MTELPVWIMRACLWLLLLQENCSACSQVPSDLHFSPSSKLQEVLDYLTESTSLYVYLTYCDALILVPTLFVSHYQLYSICFMLQCLQQPNTMDFFRQMKSPAITTTMDGKNKTLYLQVINLPFSTVLYSSSIFEQFEVFSGEV